MCISHRTCKCVLIAPVKFSYYVNIKHTYPNKAHYCVVKLETLQKVAECCHNLESSETPQTAGSYLQVVVVCFTQYLATKIMSQSLIHHRSPTSYKISHNFHEQIISSLNTSTERFAPTVHSFIKNSKVASPRIHFYHLHPPFPRLHPAFQCN